MGLANIVNEFEKAEKTKLEGFVAVYKKIRNIIEELRFKSTENEAFTGYIESLQKYMEPYRQIYLLVGNDVTSYLESEIGMHFLSEDDQDMIAKKLLMLVSSSTFFSIREFAIIACNQYLQLSELYQEITIALKKDNTEFANLQNNMIKCVQIFSQFALLGDQLAKETENNPSTEIKQVSTLVAEIGKITAFYANQAKKYDEAKEAQDDKMSFEKTLGFAAAPMIAMLLKKHNEFLQRLDTLKAGLSSEEKESLDAVITRKSQDNSQITFRRRANSKAATTTPTNDSLADIETLLKQIEENRKAIIKAEEVLEASEAAKARKNLLDSKNKALELATTIFKDSMPDPTRVKTKKDYTPDPYTPPLPLRKESSPAKILSLVRSILPGSSKEESFTITRTDSVSVSPTSPRATIPQDKKISEEKCNSQEPNGSSSTTHQSSTSTSSEATPKTFADKLEFFKHQQTVYTPTDTKIKTTIQNGK